MRESVVEAYFCRRVRELGGMTMKTYARHWPDRFAFLPGGRILAVELKRPKGGALKRPKGGALKRPKGGVLAEGQKEILSRLAALGVEVHLVRNKEQADEALLSIPETHRPQAQTAQHSAVADRPDDPAEARPGAGKR
jgi:hypothetical protein